MRITRTWGSITVGREDRLVRGCVSFSLLLLAGFAVAASGGLGFITAVFGLLGIYFAVTSVSGRDPFYRRFGIDTHGGQEGEPGGQIRTVLDLREEQPAAARDQLG